MFLADERIQDLDRLLRLVQIEKGGRQIVAQIGVIGVEFLGAQIGIPRIGCPVCLLQSQT